MADSFFNHLVNKADNKTNDSGMFIKQKPLPRGQRHSIQINKKYYMVFRKLAYKYPGTNITRWADQTLEYAFRKGYLKPWLKK